MKFFVLENIDFLSKLPFYEELNVIKTDHAFKGYALSYKVEQVEKKDPLIQSETSKSSIKYLPNDLLDKTKGFKYQIKLKVKFKKIQRHWNWIFFCLFYFNNKNCDKSI